MHYDYKNIYNVEDLFLQNDGTSIIQRPFNNTSVNDGNISQLPNNQLLALYKKNVSAYLIMQKIGKKDPIKFQLLLQKFKNKQQNEFVPNPYKSFIEDTIKGSDPSYILVTEESVRNEIKNKKIGFQEGKKTDFSQEKAVASEPDMKKTSEKIKPNKKTKEIRNYDFDEKFAINDKNAIIAIIAKNAIITEKNNLEKSVFEINTLEKSTFGPEKSAFSLEKSTLESGLEKIEKNAIEKNELEKKEHEKNELEKQDFEKKAREKLACSKNLIKAESRIKRLKKKRFRLKMPLNQQPQMQDFNDFYNHFSEDDKAQISEEDSIEDPDELISEFRQTEVTQSINEIPENTSKESSETKENLKISDENFEEIDYEKEALLIRKEISFHPSEKKETTSPLSLKKHRSNLKSRTVNRSQENSENASQHFPEENIEKEKKEVQRNPYFERIKKLLKSSDVFSEDIDDLVGVKREKKKLPNDLIFVEENERRIYELIFDWSGEMEGLLKKDQREMKRYQRKMQNIFAVNEEKEEELEEIEGESSEDESEEG